MELNLINNTGTISLRSGHSLFIGNKPDFLTNEVFNKIVEDRAVSVENFGLFETSTPNYNTYYPDLTPDQLIPKEEEFISPIFRALSATVVWKGYKPIDFSKDGVLKASMSLLVGQTINIDHEVMTGNAIGAVKQVFWQESYKDGKITVPAGINAEFKIDGKSNPRIARGIQMDPPAIHSNSVSVRFKWEQSHTGLAQDEFMQKLGTFDSKGELIRLVVTEVLQYTETSLVPHGADAWAQVIKNGKINNPQYANSVYSFSSTDTEGNKVNYSHSIDYKTDLSLELNADTILNINNNNLNQQEDMDVLKIVEKSLGLAEGTLTNDNISAQLATFISGKDKAVTDATATLTQTVADLTAEKGTLTTERDEALAFKPKAEKLDALVLAQREDAKRLYKLAKGKDASEATLLMLDTADEAVLENLHKEYAKDAEAKFSPTCKDCGSTNVNRASSFNEDEDEDDDTQTTGAVLSNSDARKAFQENRNKKQKKDNK